MRMEPGSSGAEAICSTPGDAAVPGPNMFSGTCTEPIACACFICFFIKEQTENVESITEGHSTSSRSLSEDEMNNGVTMHSRCLDPNCFFAPFPPFNVIRHQCLLAWVASCKRASHLGFDAGGVDVIVISEGWWEPLEIKRDGIREIIPGQATISIESTESTGQWSLFDLCSRVQHAVGRFSGFL
jgi:hypothetical protein